MTSITTISRLLRPQLCVAVGLAAAVGIAACSDPASSSSTTTTTTSGSTTSSTSSGSGGGGGATCDKAPPSGFTAAVAPTSDGTLGLDTAMVADENDDPMIAYQWYEPGGDIDQSSVYFTRWDRCVGAFTAPVKIDVVGPVSTNNPTRRVGLAYDRAAKKLAIAYEVNFKAVGFENNPENSVFLQTSTDLGATWTGKLHVSDQKDGDSEQATGPVVAISGGKIQIAYAQDNRACCPIADPGCGSCAGVWYLEGDGATFTRALVSDATGPIQVAGSTLSLAVDSAGKPALAFIQDPEKGYTRTAIYWRPGTTPVKVMDSNEIQNDDPSISLAFDGTRPRIAAHLVAVDSAPYDLRVASSTDGVTWTAPVQLPRDGSQFTAFYQSLAIDAKGNAAVSAYINGGSGDNTCGGPRILRSSDFKTWAACGADTDKKYADIGGKYVDTYFTHENKLTMTFYGTLGDSNAGRGVMLWREP